MVKFVDFLLDGGEKIRVEGSGEDDRVTRGGSTDPFKDSEVAFDAAMAKLKPICAAIVKQAKEMIVQPDEFSVEFGVKLSAEAGVVIAKTAAEANLKISVKWK